jgi:hypothetical protein
VPPRQSYIARAQLIGAFMPARRKAHIVIAVGKWKLHYAWVVLFAACMLNIIF